VHLVRRSEKPPGGRSRSGDPTTTPTTTTTPAMIEGNQGAAPRDLKRRTIRAGFANLCGQGASFALNLASVMILARLLDPGDFGLVAMVGVVTGLYGIFTSAGLSAATVQTATITDAQVSNLFWVNILVGMVLSLLCLATAPVLVAFYHETRLFWVTVVTASGFLISAAGIQHSALLQRQLRYVALVTAGSLSQLFGIAVGTCMAIFGFGYWALVGASLASAATGTVCVWLAAAWIPARPHWHVEIRSLLRFGGTITLNSVVVYLAYNLEKVFLGRFWGADALGVYGRAYQLVNMPTERLNGTIGAVAFSALSRLQDDPVRLRAYFLKGYSLVASMTIPITMFSALFADDIISVLLGPKWVDAAAIFRLLTPTILIFGMINPLASLLWSVGLQGRSLRIALVIAPLVLTSYAIGLPYGPSGVALAYSTAMTLWFIPHVVWCLHGTAISPWDLLRTAGRPLLSAIAAGVCVLGTQDYFGQLVSPIQRLTLGGGIMFLVYSCMLLFVLQQRAFYLDLLRGAKAPPSDALSEPKPLYAEQSSSGD
jgi:O-antigen/teichoic acid export membrane protein